ncbi:hypothetical protein B0H66DRAFT_269943 [Apodospora peruviana]|uniref:Uncharacterized protein n=1 Tax=Apodospora peruviana TaxID=516989 RepID=A0AAE0HZI7_9PEZI|nr:hypothetical protein B0H66DRAFT_269943 [Apodospora peruviana]
MANCTLYMNVTNLAFTTESYWSIQKNISDLCPNHPYLKPDTATLTTEAARHLAGLSNDDFISIWQFWTYPTDLILVRFQAWKLPLIALVALFPRPPHSKTIGLLALFNLLGNPINTIASLILTLDCTRLLVQRFRRQNGMSYKRCLELVLLVSTLRYVGDEEDAADVEDTVWEDKSLDTNRPMAVNTERWTTQHESTAHALAADRTTSFLPVLVTLSTLLISIFFAYGKVVRAPWRPSEPWHVDIYSIAFSMTLLAWVPGVLFACTIGMPQSGASPCRILRNSGLHLPNLPQKKNEIPGIIINLPPSAVPSWRYDRWPWMKHPPETSWRRWLCHEVTALVLVTIGVTGALVQSYFVPPGGFLSCRLKAQLTICVTYIISYVFGILFDTWCHWDRRLHFWLVMSKDVVSLLIVATIVAITVAGSLNTPICWVSRDRDCMELPEGTKDVVYDRLRSFYPITMGLTFGLLLVASLAVAGFLYDGMAVYVQTDDDETPFQWLREATQALCSVVARKKKKKTRGRRRRNECELGSSLEMHGPMDITVEIDDYQ